MEFQSCALGIITGSRRFLSTVENPGWPELLQGFIKMKLYKSTKDKTWWLGGLMHPGSASPTFIFNKY